jgi:recombination protein RecT
MQNQLVTQKTNTKDNFAVVRDLLEKSKNEIAKVLPKFITPERVARIALTTLRKNPKLLECDPSSFLGAVMQASQLGFELDDNLGLAYLVPFYNKKRGVKEVQLILGYRGLIELARRSGKLRSISARIVYENEPFLIEYGLLENLKHTPLPPSKRGDNIKGVYAVGTMSDSSTVFDFLWAEELEDIKKAALAKSEKFSSSSSPWSTHEEEMMKKTVIRKMMKYLSLSPEVTKAAIIDEYGEAGINTKDTFIGSETGNKTLGMTEPKAITSDKVAQLSDYKNEPPINNNNTDNQITAPETEDVKAAETEPIGPDTFTTEEDNGYFADIPWDDNDMSTTHTERTEAKTQSSKKKIDTNNLISDKQINFVYSLCHNKEIEITELKEIIATVTGTNLELEEISKKDATALIDYVKNLA